MGNLKKLAGLGPRSIFSRAIPQKVRFLVDASCIGLKGLRTTGGMPGGPDWREPGHCLCRGIRFPLSTANSACHQSHFKCRDAVETKIRRRWTLWFSTVVAVTSRMFSGLAGLYPPTQSPIEINCRRSDFNRVVFRSTTTRYMPAVPGYRDIICNALDAVGGCSGNSEVTFHSLPGANLNPPVVLHSTIFSRTTPGWLWTGTIGRSVTVQSHVSTMIANHVRTSRIFTWGRPSAVFFCRNGGNLTQFVGRYKFCKRRKQYWKYWHLRRPGAARLPPRLVLTLTWVYLHRDPD